MGMATEAHRKEIEEEEERDKNMRRRIKLDEIFAQIDENGDGGISRSEFDAMLNDDEQRDVLCDAARLHQRDLSQLFDILEKDSLIYRDDFVKALETEAGEVHERSVMKIEKRLSDMEDTVGEMRQLIRRTQTDIKYLGSQLGIGCRLAGGEHVRFGTISTVDPEVHGSHNPQDSTMPGDVVEAEVCLASHVGGADGPLCSSEPDHTRAGAAQCKVQQGANGGHAQAVQGPRFASEEDTQRGGATEACPGAPVGGPPSDDVAGAARCEAP